VQRLRDTRLRYFGLLALVSGALFLVLTALYRAGVTHEVDRDVLLQLREAHTGWLDALGTFDDLLFRPTLAFAMAGLLVLVLWRFGPRWSWCAPFAIVLTVLAEVVVKSGWSQLLHLRVLIDGVMVLFGGSYHGGAPFPSGHVTRAMFLAVIGLAFLPRWVSIPFALLALTTPIARMYTEVHRLSDVVGGAMLGVCIASAAVCGVAILAARMGRARS
jgi:membrane-associated phospholipid phosphatase